MQKESNPICIATGGTRGHLLPAEQLAFLLRKNKAEPFFAGAGLKNNPFFCKRDFPFYEIKSANFQNKRKFKSLLILLKSTFEAFGFLRKIRPKAVVGFGSYHSFPVLLAAYLLRLPIYLFEPNCILGKVNAFFAKKAKWVAVQFEAKDYQKPYFKIVAPFPWGILERREKKRKKVPTILVFGGSQGAKSLNEYIPSMLIQLAKKKEIFEVIHITGKERSLTEEKYGKAPFSYQVLTYEEDMDRLYNQIDFVIGRSGASTLAELIHYEIPACLIPYPFSTKQHQQVNASFFQETVGGGKFILNSLLQTPSSCETLEELWRNRDQYQRQMAAFKKRRLKGPHLAELILQEVQ